MCNPMASAAIIRMSYTPSIVFSNHPRSSLSFNSTSFATSPSLNAFSLAAWDSTLSLSFIICPAAAPRPAPANAPPGPPSEPAAPPTAPKAVGAKVFGLHDARHASTAIKNRTKSVKSMRIDEKGLEDIASSPRSGHECLVV